eukprot:6157763-Amphidinium_carterae.1
MDLPLPRYREGLAMRALRCKAGLKVSAMPPPRLRKRAGTSTEQAELQTLPKGSVLHKWQKQTHLRIALHSLRRGYLFLEGIRIPNQFRRSDKRTGCPIDSDALTSRKCATQLHVEIDSKT